MKLFLSYGHSESEVCRRIDQALRDRGHETWFDEEKIHAGQNWRQAIVEGIETSNGVISCLSRHSVRDPGVCLDELSIAIGVRGGNVKTILLEPEETVDPPASVRHIQWLDMSEWKTWQAKGPEKFQPWFDAKMEQLFQVIESDESRTFSGQITIIQDKLDVNYDASKQRDLLRRLFVGRGWLTEQLERWLDDPEGARLCVLYGDPGVGKSAFAANYIHYNHRVAAGLFCEYGQPTYNEPETVLKTLAYLLACRLPDYRAVLADILEREDRVNALNASELFRLLLADPFTSLVIDGGHETLCIVIDGLDECDQGERNALAETLARYVPRLPAWLRVLVTAREVAAVKAPLASAFTLELHGDAPQNQEDVRAYFAARLEAAHGGDPAWDQALDTLTAHSGGIFLYAQLVCDGILAGKLSIHDTDRFPEGLSDAFYQWFSWSFPDDREYRDDCCLPLGTLLASPEPLPEEELKRIFGWGNNELNGFLRRVEVLVRRDVNNFGKETLTFTHLYLKEWLSSKQAGLFQSDPDDGLKKMAERYYQLFQADPKALTEYESLHLVSFLTRCGMTAQLSEVALSRDVFQRIIDAGDYCRKWGKLPAALNCYEQAQAMARQIVKERSDFGDRYALCISDSRAADILRIKGNLDGAMELYQKCSDIVEQLVRERGAPHDLSMLTISCSKVANILQTKGDLDGAMELYQKCLDMSERLVRERGAPQDRGMLAASYSGIANILQTRDDLDGAMELFRKGLEIRERLAQELETPSARRVLSASYGAGAGILRIKGDLDGALELYRKGLEIRERLARELGTPDARRELSVSYENVAGILWDKGDQIEAMKLYRDSAENRERLAWELDTPQVHRDFGNICSRLAGILRSRGDLDGALELHRKSLEIRELVVKELDTPGTRRALSDSYNNIADILETKSDRYGALELYQKSLEIRERLARELDTPDAFRALCVNYEKIGRNLCNLAPNLKLIFWNNDNEESALELYRKSLKIRERLVQEQGTPEDRRCLANVCILIADVLQGMGDLDEAQELYQKVFEIVEQLAQEFDNPNARRALGNCYGWVAGILRDKGDLDDAVEQYRKSAEIREQLIQELDMPEDGYDFYHKIDLIRDLSITCQTIAQILRKKGDLDGALEFYRRNLELAKQLAGMLLNSQDNLIWAYLDLVSLPSLPDAERLAYAKEGLSVSMKYYSATDHFCMHFHDLIQSLEPSS